MAKTVEGITFNNVVNAVDDLGMDPNGNNSIDNALQNAIANDTLIEFPAGTYRVASEYVYNDSISKWGIEGIATNRDDVEFIFPNANNAYFFLHQDGGSDVVWKNFQIDTDNKIVSIRNRANDNGIIKNIRWRGWLPERTDNPGQMIDMTCLTQDGVNHAEDLVIGREGAYVNGHPSQTGSSAATAFRFYPDHAGETIIKNLEVQQMGNHSIRKTKGDGVVKVYDSFIKNSHLSHVRIDDGDHPSKESLIENCTLVIDHSEALDIGNGAWDEAGCSAVFMDSTGGGHPSSTVRDCEIVARSVTTESEGGWGLIRVAGTGQSDPGGGLFENCRIRNDTHLQTVWIDERSADAQQPHYWVFDNCEFQSLNDTQERSGMFYMEADWDNSEIKNSKMYLPNGTVDAISLNNVDNVSITDTEIETGGQQIVTNNATFTTTNVTNTVNFEWTTFRISGIDNNTVNSYSFTIEGTARANAFLSSFGTVDSVVNNGDGTYTVSGTIYSGDDAFEYQGDGIIDYAVGDDMEFYRDGQQITEGEIIDASTTPSGDSLYQDTFFDVSAGNTPTAWTAGWDSVNSDFTVSDKETEFDNSSLDHNPSASGRHSLSSNDMGSIDNFQVLALVRFDDASTSGHWCNLYGRMGGTVGSEDTYFTSFVRDGSGGWELSIDKFVGGTESALNSTAVNVNPVSNWTWVRFQGNNEFLKSKTWEYGSDEPSGWDVETSDTDLTSGELGVGGTPSDLQEFDFVSFVDAASEAPTPFGYNGMHVFHTIPNSASPRSVQGVKQTIPPSINVETNAATSVGETAATLNMDLNQFRGFYNADLYFEWKQSANSTWNSTTPTTVSQLTTNSENITSLSDETQYDFRANAQAIGGEEILDTGNVLNFTTDQAVIYVDQFNDTDFSEWSPNSELSSVSNPLGDGRDCVQVGVSGDSFTRVGSQPGDGLNAYPSQGDRFKVDVGTEISFNQSDIRYGRADNSNYFEVEFEWAAGDVVFIERDAGVDTVVGSTSFSTGPNLDEWYTLDVTWDDGTLGGNAGDHTIDVLDQSGNSVLNSPITANRTANSSNSGVGMTQGGSTDYWFVDEWRIVN